MVATRHVTIEEFAFMPDVGQWELTDGELIEVAPASSLPSREGGRFYAQFVLQLEDKRLG